MGPQGIARTFISASLVENLDGHHLLQQDDVIVDLSNLSTDSGTASIARCWDSRHARTFGLQKPGFHTPHCPGRGNKPYTTLCMYVISPPGNSVFRIRRANPNPSSELSRSAYFGRHPFAFLCTGHEASSVSVLAPHCFSSDVLRGDPLRVSYSNLHPARTSLHPRRSTSAWRPSSVKKPQMCLRLLCLERRHGLVSINSVITNRLCSGKVAWLM